MHLNNGRSSGNGAKALEGTTSRIMMASRPKVSILPDDSVNPRNYGTLFVYVFLLFTFNIA
jgi:hypothetical protein